METVSVTQARDDLFDIIDFVLGGRKIRITSEKGNVILLSEEEWNGITETLYLLSDPDTLPAVTEARATPASELEGMDWKNML